VHGARRGQVGVEVAGAADLALLGHDRSASAERRAEYQRDHEEIVTALRLRAADRATVAMRTHLTRVSAHLLGTE
jgi:DNA-binding FadR family transcriptional regulator